MKLLYLTTARIPDEWAHVMQIMTMCDAFTQAGAEVTLVAPRRAATPAADPFVFANVPASFTLRKLPCLDLLPGTKSRFLFWIRSVSYLLFVVSHLMRTRGAIIYTRDPLLVIGSHLAGKQAIWEIHTAERNWLTRRAAHVAAKIIPISKGLRDYCRSLGVPEDRIHVENDGVTLEAFAHLPDKFAARAELGLPEGKIVAYVGKYRTMGETKGVEGLIEAFARAVQKEFDAILLIVGLYPEELPEVEELARMRALLPSQYRLVPHVPKADVPRYLRAADVLVMNYPNTYHYAHIMSPLKMYEYMASGVPIVSSDLPTIREALTEKSACLVAPDDPEALAEGITRIARDTKYAARIAAQALADVGQHTWKARAVRILRFI